MTGGAVARSGVAQRARLLAYLTIGWNTLEGVIAVAAGVAAGSVALVGFGLDSGVEVFAGAVVLWQLRDAPHDRERRALRLIALSFFALALYVMAESIRDLTASHHAEESVLGIGLAATSLVVMPALAAAKRRVGRQLDNRVVIADATETALCAYLSAILLGGLVFNATVGWWWADPLAALGIAGLAMREGREAWHGDPCCAVGPNH